ncbi:MAG: nitronate monooxygenase [Sphaerospermopsis sp. SIO1G2]|nr:nitronate monooxygenase [Sphaerospermopsis sp. SIO1G2]
MTTASTALSFADKFRPISISGKEVLPIIEGGKGIGATNGISAGAFAAAGAVGTFSGVNPERRDEQGNIIPYSYQGTTRRERHHELVAMSIEGAVQQARIAHEVASSNGRIHMNILWEMGGAEQVLVGALEQAAHLIHGVTCGAGMPYKLGEIAAHYNVYYHPIVSSMRAFRALWKRSYEKTKDWIGSVVYEDPWLAGGHNGLSNSEDPRSPQDPYARVVEIRRFMNQVGLQHVPIIMAGGAWHLRDWEDWLDNDEVGAIAFQFGTRPLLTQESPIPNEWKKRLLALKEGDVFLNRFSPTGFYSSAYNNNFIGDLRERGKRQVPYKAKQDDDFSASIPFGPRKRPIYVTPQDKIQAEEYIADGYDELMKTPDDTVIFVTKEQSATIHEDQVNCMGCLSHCRFSNWKDHDDYTTGKKADPRSFCIQKTLQDIVGGGSIDHNLMFSGHNAFKFGQDPFYHDGFIPTVKELVERIVTGL